MEDIAYRTKAGILYDLELIANEPRAREIKERVEATNFADLPDPEATEPVEEEYR